MDLIYSFKDYALNFDPNTQAVFIIDERYKHSIPWGASILYLLMLYILPKIIKKPVESIKYIIPYWNLLLSFYSAITFLGTVYCLTYHLPKYGIYGTFCNSDVVYHRHLITFISYIFIISKIFELFDTLFLILKHPEQKIEFLHWWHHLTVLIFTWYCALWRFGCGYYFMLMNSIVHTFMYYYYYLTAVGHRPSWAKLLTIGQIAQMILGSFLNFYWIYLYYTGTTCSCEKPGYLVIFCAIIYGSYLYLFLDFFVRKYISGTLKKSKDVPAAHHNKKDE